MQRRTTRLIADIRHLPYTQLLQSLKLPSLYYRRKRGDMILVYQILRWGIAVQPDVFFTPATTTATRGHQWKLKKDKNAEPTPGSEDVHSHQDW